MTEKQKRFRVHVVKEIFDTEREYTRSLEFTVTVSGWFVSKRHSWLRWGRATVKFPGASLIQLAIWMCIVRAACTVVLSNWHKVAGLYTPDATTWGEWRWITLTLESAFEAADQLPHVSPHSASSIAHKVRSKLEWIDEAKTDRVQLTA